MGRVGPSENPASAGTAAAGPSGGRTGDVGRARHGRPWLWPWFWRVAAALVLALVFLAYAQPSLMQHLADQVWGCF
ncbi:hypothetical protein DES44_1858 [Roseateles depolymerans]|uniref:Uncharacterized protein n=1 Tax=Roseateles depolymerans TaxID=76731 RepID=A0A0U3CCD8_9BURK|nr:hypothetical protein RD2015_1913 [Roseateles depolymerans]REG19364.1 hypothetical protein DES44_1858 [Roseateles depolymerans]